MKEIVNNIIKEYKEIKYLNERKIEELNNENLYIDSFLRDIKLITDCYENKIERLRERINELKKEKNLYYRKYKKCERIENIFSKDVIPFEKLEKIVLDK